MFSVVTFLLVTSVCMPVAKMAASTERPNIIFILTDDQDTELGGLIPMNKARKIIQDEGMNFENMFVTTPICCPSRSSILTGQYVQTHRTVNNSVNGNCNSLEWQRGPEKRTFVSYLNKLANYTTFFAGKYLNQYGKKRVGGVKHVPDGWDEWHGLVGNSVYYNYTLSCNGKPEYHGSDHQLDYLTDVIKRKAIRFLRDVNANDPFFMMLATPACHGPFTPAEIYKDRYNGSRAKRTPNFYTYPGESKHWLLRQVPKNPPKDVVKFTDQVFRHRLQTLLSVDDLVEAVVEKLKNKRIINKTYVFFSSDNGFHLGQFSLPVDKRQLYEFDIRVPLMVRGPGIQPSTVDKHPVLNIDLAPTFLDLAGLPVPTGMDGRSIVPLLMSESRPTPQWRTEFNVEYYGESKMKIAGCPQYDNQGVANCHPDCICEDSWNNTYVCARTFSSTRNTILCSFNDHEKFVEAYDIDVDPYQMHNLAYDSKKNRVNRNFCFARHFDSTRDLKK